AMLCHGTGSAGSGVAACTVGRQGSLALGSLAAEAAVDNVRSATIKVSLRDANWRAVRSSGRSSRTRSAGATQAASAPAAGPFVAAIRDTNAIEPAAAAEKNTRRGWRICPHPPGAAASANDLPG